MPNLYMLIGPPGVGKSTWVANQMFDWNNTVIASTDNYIDRKAAEHGKTYSDVFKSEIDNATSHMNSSIADAVKNGYNIIWDQTNISAKARKHKLKLIPDSYKKIAVFFQLPDEKELARRLANRPGKNIPDDVMKSMIANTQEPSTDEGFDEIIIV